MTHVFQRYEETEGLFTFSEGNVYTFMPERGSSQKTYDTPQVREREVVCRYEIGDKTVIISD